MAFSSPITGTPSMTLPPGLIPTGFAGGTPEVVHSGYSGQGIFAEHYSNVVVMPLYVSVTLTSDRAWTTRYVASGKDIQYPTLDQAVQSVTVTVVQGPAATDFGAPFDYLSPVGISRYFNDQPEGTKEAWKKEINAAWFKHVWKYVLIAGLITLLFLLCCGIMACLPYIVKFLKKRGHLDPDLPVAAKEPKLSKLPKVKTFQPRSSKTSKAKVAKKIDDIESRPAVADPPPVDPAVAPAAVPIDSPAPNTTTVVREVPAPGPVDEPPKTKTVVTKTPAPPPAADPPAATRASTIPPAADPPAVTRAPTIPPAADPAVVTRAGTIPPAPPPPPPRT